MQKCHEGIRYKCSVDGCGKEYSYKGNLSHHIKARHTKMVACSICNVKVTSTYLINHMRKIHIKTHLCSYCDRQFGSETLVKQHEKKIHTNEKNVKCRYCDAKFKNSCYMKVHIKGIHRKCQYNCRVPGCKKAFNSKTNYRRHIAVHKKLTDEEREMYLKKITAMKPDEIHDLE